MQGIEVSLKRNKQFIATNLEEYEIIAGENNATTILVHFPNEYENYSKRVDFKNIRNEKWTIPLYTPEDETKQYGNDFDKLNFAFTLPTPVTINGELQIQFIAYMADNTETFVPFKLLKIIVEDAIMYVKKEGTENPDLILQAYEYSNMALEISRDSFNRIENAERAALSAEESSTNAENSALAAQSSATSAQDSASSANIRAENAESSARAAEKSADNAEQVSNEANTKSTNAVNTSNTANTKSDNAVSTANTALGNSEEALEISNSANTKSNNAVSVSNSANTKSDNAISTANEAKETAEEALNQVVEKMGTKIFIGDSENPESNINLESDPQTQINNLKSNKTTIANSNGGFSCGSGASNTKGMTFKGFTLCDENGKIPVARLFDAIYPVGSIYMSINSTNPGNLFGGTWVAWGAGRVPVGIGSNGETNYTSAESTGGSENSVATHTHTQNSHNHTQNSHAHTQVAHRHRLGSIDTYKYDCAGFGHGNADNGVGGGAGDYSGSLNYYDTDKFGHRLVENSTPTINGSTATNNATTATNNNTGVSGGNRQPYITCYMWKRTG